MKPTTMRIIAGAIYFSIHRGDGLAINYVSERCLTMLDLPRDRLMSDPADALARVHPEDIAGLASLVADALATLSPLFWEGRVVIRGETRWYSLELFPLGNPGDATFWEGIIIDISAQRSDLDDFIKKQKIYENILASSAQGFWISDLQGRILETNDAYCEMVGMTREELVGAPITSLDTLFSTHEVNGLIEELMATGRLNFGTMHRHKNGNEIPLLVSSNYNPTIPERIFTFLYDLREGQDDWLKQKAVQDIDTSIRRRIDKAESVMINISEKTLRHIGQELHDDLGQILYAAYLETSVLSRNIVDTSSPMADKIGKIEHYLKQSIARIRNISTGLYPSGLDTLGLVPMVEDVIHNVASTTSIITHHAIHGDFSGIDPERALQVFRIVQEAVSNAVRHSGASHLSLDMRIEDGALELSITDDGIGVDIPHSRTTAGLGLVTMRSRARLMGGRLEIASLRRRGTRVHLVAPLDSEHAPKET
ncbi:MAG: PAS domain S-box protein [Porticoccaceae bacterium]